VGRSGAGKSTLLRCLNLLERPTSGSVLFDGEDLTKLPPAKVRAARRKIGMIFQHFNLLSSRTVYGNVAFPLELDGRSREEIEAAVMPLLEFVGLGALKDRYPAQLSGGQAQRVGIARALANRPELLLCDEATSALDPQTTGSILALLRRVNAEFGLTIVVVTHEMPVVKGLCDRVAFLQEGRVVECARVIDLFLAPSPAAQAFLAEPAPAELAQLAGAKLLAGAPADGFRSALWRLGFGASSARDSIVSALVRNFDLELSIVSGSIERVAGTLLGVLFVEVGAQAAVLDAARAYLAAHEVAVEELGYVGRSAVAAR
jgi:D-methionine transport system ATP-binding protein